MRLWLGIVNILYQVLIDFQSQFSENYLTKDYITHLCGEPNFRPESGVFPTCLETASHQHYWSLAQQARCIIGSLRLMRWSPQTSGWHHVRFIHGSDVILVFSEKDNIQYLSKYTRTFLQTFYYIFSSDKTEEMTLIQCEVVVSVRLV